LRHGVAQQADGADRRQADHPPQHLAHHDQGRGVEGQEALARLADLERRHARPPGPDHQDLQHVERQRGLGRAVDDRGRGLQAQDVGRHQARQEVEPRAGGLGRVRLGGGDRGVQAGLQDQAQGDADGHGDQGGDREPQQGAPDQPRGVLQFAQVGDAGDDGGEHQRRHQGAQQLDEDRSDLAQGLGQPKPACPFSGPSSRASRPRPRPMTMAMSTWKPNPLMKRFLEVAAAMIDPENKSGR
jgi:hypothetical protein